MMSSSGQRDQPINRQLANQCPTTMSGSVEGSTLPGEVEGMDRSRATEARNLERFRVKAGFEAPGTRFQDSNPEEKPSDPAD